MRAQTPSGLRRVRPSPLAYVALLVLGLPLLVVAIALVLHVTTTEPRDTRGRVMREAQAGVLAPDEMVLDSVPVYQRPAGDYFRATRGVLLLTDRRLVHVGLLPRDIFVADAGPDAFVRRALPIDTTAAIAAGRGFLGVDRAIVVSAPAGRISLSVDDEHWDDAPRAGSASPGRWPTRPASPCTTSSHAGRRSAPSRAATGARWRSCRRSMPWRGRASAWGSGSW